MNYAINKALNLTRKDGITRYVYATFTGFIIDYKKPLYRHCIQVNPDGTVIEFNS